MCDGECVLVTLTSAKAFWSALHTSLALISGLEAFPDSPSITSSVTGCNSGSVSTSLTVLESNRLRNPSNYCAAWSQNHFSYS